MEYEFDSVIKNIPCKIFVLITHRIANIHHLRAFDTLKEFHHLINIKLLIV